MADNVAITAGSGTTVAADDIGSGVLAQRVKPVWGVDGTGNDTSFTNPMPVTPTPAVTGGWTPYSNTALGSTKASVKTAAGTLGGWMIYNPNTVVAYVQVFDVASGSVTVGTTTPTYVLSIPPTSAANLEATCGINHATAIIVAATTTPTGSGNPTTGLVVAMFYK